jgi:hypothetical protein
LQHGNTFVPNRYSIAAPVLGGVVVGLVQAATPIFFWWLEPSTVYAPPLAAIAGVYVGFAVADGRWTVIAVESAVATAFIIVAIVAVTESPWFLVLGLAGHGFKDFWQHVTNYVNGTRWWPPFCAAVDFVVSAIIVLAIVAGVEFH